MARTIWASDIPVSGTDKPMVWVQYADQDMKALLERFFRVALPLPPYSLPTSHIDYAAPLASNAFMAFIAGDEKISPQEEQKIDSLNYITPKPEFVIGAMNSFRTDNGIKNMKWHIKLTDP